MEICVSCKESTVVWDLLMNNESADISIVRNHCYI